MDNTSRDMTVGLEGPLAYTVPIVVEQTSRGERVYDIFSLLL